jgi:AsmA protein
LTAATGLRRLGIALLAVVAVGASMLTAAGYLISPNAVRRQVLNEVHAVTGLNPILGGKATVTLFPTGSVSFGDVKLGNAKTPALTAERLTAHLRFFPLLVGRVEIADVSLVRPTIAVDLEKSGGSNWSGLIKALARSQKPDAQRTAGAFSEMRIRDGTVVVRDMVRKRSQTFDHVAFSLAWPSISKSFGASGHLVWHDQSLDVTVMLGDFAAALAGQRSGLKLRIEGQPIKVAFEGAISVQPSLKIDGTLAADAASLRDALIWAGQKPLPGGGFGRFAIKAKADIADDSIGLTNVNVELDGNTAEGVLTMSTEGRKTLQGTLAADTLDLTPYISTVKLLAANEHEWNDGRVTLAGLSGSDLDLRVSAAKVELGDAKIGRVAIGTTLRNGELVITIGEAQAYGGVIKGAVTLANFNQGVNVKSQLQFNEVDLQTCLGQLFGLRRLKGKGNIAFSVEGSGDSVLAVTHTLNGTASLTGANGAITGFDVEQLLRRLERRPLSGGGDFRTGRTPYDKIAVDLKIVQGKINVEKMKVEGPDVKLAMAGSASIPTRQLDLTGTAFLVAAAKPGTLPFSLPFMVQGSWDDPIMLPDAEALIRRSGAAAPLLNALRDRLREKPPAQ